MFRLNILSFVLALFLTYNTQAKVSTPFNVIPIKQSLALPAKTSKEVKSFKEWKLEQSALSFQQYEKLKNTPGVSSVKVSEAKVLYELSTELSISDYFVGYLAKWPDQKDAFKKASAKLSPDEVSDLMTAYANSLFVGEKQNLPVQGSQPWSEPTLK